MKGRAISLVVLVFGCIALVLACEAVPNFTFTADASSEDASVADARSSDDESDSSKTDATPPMDASNDASAAGDASSCGGGAGDICCGTEICHNCMPTDCAQCLGLACGAVEVCCAKGPSNILCKPPGQGC